MKTQFVNNDPIALTIRTGTFLNDERMRANGRQIELGRDAARQKAQLGKNPPGWAVDEAKWEKAKAAADKSYSEGDDAYWPSVVTIYENMGGTIKGK
jgi:hypothetical protein